MEGAFDGALTVTRMSGAEVHAGPDVRFHMTMGTETPVFPEGVAAGVEDIAKKAFGCMGRGAGAQV